MKVSDISRAVAGSFDVWRINDELQRIGIKTDVEVIQVHEDGTVYIGGGENDTAFEITFTLAVSEVTIGWSTYRVTADEDGSEPTS